MFTKSQIISLLLGNSIAQQIGTQKTEYHPPLSLHKCTKAGGCQSEAREVTIDANWRWLHGINGYQNCYTGNEWDKKFCPDDKSCAKNCALDGVDQATWGNTYGVKAGGDDLSLGFVTQGQYSKNVGSRTFMMNGDKYEMFKLLNHEFTFDVDVSNMPCGLNGALYFVAMESDGGQSRFPGDAAGAKYGTGYCDAQCPRDVKFINGEGNVDGWSPSPSDPNAGQGQYGSCCAEMDIWEANKTSEAVTAHPCNIQKPTRCEGDKACGDGDYRDDGPCAKDGCDLNPYRTGVTDFYGSGSNFKVDTTKKFTVVTQFITSDGTDTGDLSEIRRVFVQDGTVHEHPKSNTGGSKEFDSITDEMCDAFKETFGDINDFKNKGGLKAMGEPMKDGMVLVMSIWDDHAEQMLWLDSNSPKDKTTIGGPRGPCATTSGVSKDVESQHPDAHVVFSNIKIGEIGSTYPSGPSPPGPTPPGPSGCPGGSLSACIDLCPSSPAVAFKDCVESCTKRCDKFDGGEFLEKIIENNQIIQ